MLSASNHYFDRNRVFSMRNPNNESSSPLVTGNYVFAIVPITFSKGWVQFSDGRTSVKNQRVAVKMLCNLFGYNYTPPYDNWGQEFWYVGSRPLPAAGGQSASSSSNVAPAPAAEQRAAAAPAAPAPASVQSPTSLQNPPHFISTS